MNVKSALATVVSHDARQELKEAVADAHLEFIRRWTSGAGSTAESSWGASLQKKLASGFLLPRENVDGDDEASAIRVETLGMDVSLADATSGTARLTLRLSVYLRALPTAPELFADDGFHLPPADYSTAVKREMQERRKALQQERKVKELSPMERREAKALIAAEVECAYGITPPEKAPGPALGDEAAAEDDEMPHAEPVGVARRRRIPSPLSRKYDVPLAFARIDVPPVTTELPLPFNANAWASAAAQVERDLGQAIKAACLSWLGRPDGVSRAWRKGTDPVSEDFWSEEAWDAYLARVRKVMPVSDDLLPLFSIGIRLDAVRLRDQPGHSVRIAIENHKQQDEEREYGLFLVGLDVTLPRASVIPARLERVRRSYHLDGCLDVPAIGVNCGIVAADGKAGKVILSTSWMPRYVLPRLVPHVIRGVDTAFSSLCDPTHDPAALHALPDAIKAWAEALRASSPGMTEHPEQQRHFDHDLASWIGEADRIRKGIDLLVHAKAAWQVDRTSSESLPWRAWLATQLSFHRLYGPRSPGNAPGWRLFQLAFLLSHVPTLASRVPGYESPRWFDATFDEDSATLLYLSTGGGKTEAFFGTVVYALMIDRLRGKARGVTAMLHYPLRLLTVQQAQRLARTVAAAEMVRREIKAGGASFEIGFWVGSGNTPNEIHDRKGEVWPQYACVPIAGSREGTNEIRLMDEKNDDQTSRHYRAAQVAWNKFPTCPFCDIGGTALRLFRGPRKTVRLGITCLETGCDWNKAHGGAGKVPLPFLLVDADIYRRAPSILLGTIDKLAAIGFRIERICEVGGMFGLARGVTRGMDGLLDVDPDLGTEDGRALVAPAHAGGEDVFLDPLPALIIQDEMHLLDESLGSFGGLFETSLFAWFRSIATIPGMRSCRYPGAPDKPRLPHVIGATATASDALRHVRALYQRNVVQFPHPGHALHESFYVRYGRWEPGRDAETARAVLAAGSPLDREAAAPWARIYASLMTNGRKHTMTTMAVLAAHAAASTRWLRDLADPATRDATAREIAEHQSSYGFRERRRDAVLATARDGHWDALLHLVDLHRIMLTYVTNKKGGDQVLSAIADEVRESHRLMGPRYALDDPKEGMRFGMELISGGVDVGMIQKIVSIAEKEKLFPSEEAPFDPASDPPWRGLRGIVATSAISHGVDVENFNAMAFAGLPSDVAEYIQASSRVGRMHVGFSLLVPIPQVRRDRYVVEVHEHFHRLLDRMIAPPAAERWAENAIRRVVPSMIQNWLVGVHHALAFALATPPALPTLPLMTGTVASIFKDPKKIDACVKHICAAMGTQAAVGGAANSAYYEAIVRECVGEFVKAVKATSMSIKDLWANGAVSGLFPPMTSLRDVDGQAVIQPARMLRRRDVKRNDIAAGLAAIKAGSARRTPRGSEYAADEAIRGGKA